MSKKFFLSIIYILVVSLVVGLPFAFVEWNPILIDNIQVFVIYLISKIVFLLLLIIACLWSIKGKHARGNIYQLSLVSFFFQLVPLVIRAGVFIPSFQLGYSLIILVVSLVVYVGYLGLLFISDKKQLVSLEKYTGKEIPVKED